jgi:anti-sigma-K factor RskA
MDCEKCQELLSDYLDGALSGDARARFGRHLGECAACAASREDLAAIVGAARECREQLVAPPDERAMWLRIRNTVEEERRVSSARAATAAAGQSFWGRLAARRWALTLPQLATATAGVAVSVALVTALGMRALLDGRRVEQPRARVVRQLQNQDDMVRIEYLRQRVDQRRARWDAHMRDTFDRNMSVIDETVNEMLKELDERPHDEVSEETLNAAMRDKIELLKEFSEL